MTKILYIPESRYLMFVQATDYSVIAEEITSYYGSVLAQAIKVSANGFITRLCDNKNTEWDVFKQYHKLAKPCLKQEFEVIDE